MMDDGSWKVLNRKYLYRKPWCAFRVDEVMPPSGEAIEYVVLVCQWRHPPERFTLELPSGAVDPGGKPEEAAPGAF